ncbi:MAG TPA: hypothetical protein VKT82_22440 [Ktedonobacterales bacterium]|nr:hypothetical protein [Ktedonobacterales bacterium]
MLNMLRHWHWTLLHRVFGLPDRNHTEPHAPLSALLRSHPEVPAHGQHFAQPNRPGLQSQLARERQRQPRILKSWQRSIGAAFERQSKHRSEF